MTKTNALGNIGSNGRMWWKPIVHFAAHTLVGSLIFVVISLPAFGLGQLVKLLTANGVAPYVANVLTILEYAIVTVDALLFLWHLLTTAYATLKDDS